MAKTTLGPTATPAAAPTGPGDDKVAPAAPTSAGTVVVRTEPGTFRLDHPLVALKNPYNGTGGTQREVRWRLVRVSDSATVVDTLLRVPDGTWVGADWADLSPATGPCMPAVAYDLQAQTRNTLGETSAWSGAVRLTAETRLTAATWGASQ